MANIIKNFRNYKAVELTKRYMSVKSNISLATQFVPKHSPVEETDVVKLKDFISSRKKILVVTGAGISTESGIPDYRSEGVGMYARTSSRPILLAEFMKSEKVRQRYWARNYVGWPRFSSFHPNLTHYTLRELEKRNKTLSIITQNVDGLHSKAGSNRVVELHGTAFRVSCMQCGGTIDRHEFQKVLMLMNPNMRDTEQIIRPDGDVELSQNEVDSFKVPECVDCSGIMKPDIVFFGGHVPLARVEHINNLLYECDSLLVLGSSLSVFSGYRLLIIAEELKKDIAIVNIGPTRGDSKATLKISAKCGDILPKILETKS